MTLHDQRPTAPAPAPFVPAPAPPAPTTRRPRSPLGRLALSLIVLATGVIALLDLSGVPVTSDVYLAVALLIVGAALVVGTWYGRAHWLIILGVVLSISLVGSIASHRRTAPAASVTWRPATISQLSPTYTMDVGNAVLDLSGIDFAGRNATVAVKVGLGNLAVIVPATVDVRADAQVNVGDADVFGTHWDGIGVSSRTVVDHGADGPGGGTLVIHAETGVGNVEVRR